MSTITRTLRNLWRVGFKEYGHQIQYIGDTKAGTFIGMDRYGNKYYENLTEELPLRTRWVDYKDRELDPSHIEPGWHAWISYLVDKPPVEDKIMEIGIRPWESKEPKINMTQSRAAYRPYSTTQPKYSAWDPVAKPRDGSTPSQAKTFEKEDNLNKSHRMPDVSHVVESLYRCIHEEFRGFHTARKAGLSLQDGGITDGCT